MPLSESRIDALVAEVMQQQSIPGLSLAVWQGGKVRLSKGYGVADIHSGTPVDPQTLFKIGSATKAFTAAALALLVEEGKLGWDARVVDHLPGFALADPWVTREFRVEDLLTHRSGLGRGAGDLMLWPQPNHFSRDDIVAGLRHLPLPGRFRADYAYDNLLYIVAGELVAAVSGMPWEAFVQQRLLQPLGLRDCHAGPVPRHRRDNLALPHLRIDGEAVLDRPNLPGFEPIVSAAAGGMHCSAADMLTWLRTLLGGGVAPGGERLLHQAQRDRLWRPVTLMPLSEARSERDGSHFYAYALGWRVQDMHGLRVIHHTGSLSGMYAWTALVPELDLAMVMLMNRSSGPARAALSYSLLMPWLQAPPQDWVAQFLTPRAQQAASAREHPLPAAGPAASPAQLAGVYEDPWFGRVSIFVDDGRLRFRAHKSPRLVGTLAAEGSGRWRLRWDDRTLYADVWLTTDGGEPGSPAGLLLHPVSPDIDFSYDFQDLVFARVTTPD